MPPLSLFSKPDDCVLLAVILGAPLVGAFFNGVFGKRVGKAGVRLMALSAIGISFLASVLTFLSLHEVRHEAERIAHTAFAAAHHGGAAGAEPALAPTKLSWLAWTWFSMASPTGDGRLPIDVKLSVDELSAVMMLIVTGVGFLIHVYATSYMAKDPGFHRFFAYLNLFIFAMLTLVLADNMPLMFVGWEGVGLCSYLLIGFWYEKLPNAAAGRKAFIANRIGDVGMIGGMLVLAYYTGALDWDGINKGSDGLLQRIVLWDRPDPLGPISVSAATVGCLALFLGCTGKSAQIPLYVWLPDAMAGPTPVSALIHAATMVTSGIYLICRLNLVFSFSPFTMMIVAVVGAATALFAATIGLVQNDIKKVLAYSTVSQLGFMFLGVGVGAFQMGFFHVFTHAFFKACLFLGAGSVIHAIHARIHDDDKSQDMREMGGLRRFMPWTYLSMGAATLAIAGFPFTSGFFSKDGILFHAFGNRVVHPYKVTAEALIKDLGDKGMTGTPQYAQAVEQVKQYFEAPRWLGPTLFFVGILAATCTAFYMFRLVFMTFWGEFRGWKIDPQAALATSPFENVEPLADDLAAGHALDQTDHADHADQAHGEHHDDLTVPGPPPHEAPWQMALPVAILGVFALFAGFLLSEPLHIEPLGHWLHPIFREASEHFATLRPGVDKLEWPLMAPGVGAFLVGSAIAWSWYVKGQGRVPARVAASLPRLYRAAYNKWYVDEIYETTIIGGTDALAEGSAMMDTWIIDGILAKLTALLASALGGLLRAFQNGVVHVYAGAVAAGGLVIFVFFARPHPQVTVHRAGEQFTLEAAPGLGYEYRWNLGDGAADPAFSTGDDATKRTLTLKPDEKKTVTLEVRNAFGRVASRSVEVASATTASSAVPLGFEKVPKPGRPTTPRRTR